jgi:hypothetical protein
VVETAAITGGKDHRPHEQYRKEGECTLLYYVATRRGGCLRKSAGEPNRA